MNKILYNQILVNKIKNKLIIIQRIKQQIIMKKLKLKKKSQIQKMKI